MIPPPIFVGGTGRSGTTITGRLLGHKSQYAVLPVEAKFHADPQGVPGLLAGHITLEDMVASMEHWYAPSGTRRRGLATIVPHDVFAESLDRFIKSWDTDRVEAARCLVRELLSCYPADHGQEGWIEMTPRNVLHAGVLVTLFPDLKMIHVVRDGRDVASSLVRLEWIDDPLEAIEWWERRMLLAHRAAKDLPDGALHLVHFEDFILRKREETFAGLLDFLGWESEPGLERFFEKRMSGSRANIGRWRTDLPSDAARAVDERYSAAIERLRAVGAHELCMIE